jgi:Phosphopantetheine attachment site.
MEFDLLKEIIAEVLNVDTAEIKESTTFVDDLGADSLDVFQIIMGVEEKLNIEVDTDAAEKL